VGYTPAIFFVLSGVHRSPMNNEAQLGFIPILGRSRRIYFHANVTRTLRLAASNVSLEARMWWNAMEDIYKL